MNKRKESPKITDNLLKFYNYDILKLLLTTFYRRGSDGCNLTFYQYVRCLHSLGFVPGHRIIRINTKLPWSATNIRLKNDPAHKKMVDINNFYLKAGNPKPKKVIIKMRGGLDGE